MHFVQELDEEAIIEVTFVDIFQSISRRNHWKNNMQKITATDPHFACWSARLCSSQSNGQNTKTRSKKEKKGQKNKIQ